MKLDLKKIKPGKKSMVVTMVALLACAAVYLNWSYQQTEKAANEESLSSEYEAVDSRRILGQNYEEVTNETSVEVPDMSGYFDATRLSRKQARDEAVSILVSTEASTTASNEAKANASEEIAKIAENTVVEARIEGLVIAKGYEDCVAYINANGCNVVVAATGSELSESDVAKIKDIVVSETGLGASMIKIVEAVS
ncbi:MAG: SpoIIIAH-like family protein [Clostridia bacterium]|nr:SpoIIIAH-like family protein [Clostridia bacterium]